jgi:PHD/YefM family antitoxin component YafN of YafNO toxin-antitoxin module
MPVQTKPDLSSVAPAVAEVMERLSDMLERLMSRAAEYLVLAMIRRGEHAAVVLSADEYETYTATAELLDDAEAMKELRLADLESDEEAVPYEVVRRELGIA